MKKVVFVFAMGAFMFSCGGPDVCDCMDNAMNVMDASAAQGGTATDPGGL